MIIGKDTGILRKHLSGELFDYVKIRPGASTGLPKYFLKFPTIKTNGGHCYYASYADILRLGNKAD